MARVVTVFGGTGFLGSRIVRRLLDEGCTVRVAVRNPNKVDLGQAGKGSGKLEPVQANVREEASVAAAVKGAQAVVNAVALYIERGPVTFDAIHVRGARRVAEHTAQAGVERLVHLSGIGADAASRSAYIRARARGEEAVREAFAQATVLRPSVMFGPGDGFLTTLARIARLSPVMPLFGDGSTRLQPVFVENVAEAVLKTLADPAAAGKVFELGGPRVYTYREILELVSRQIGRRRVLLPVPFAVWQAQARLAGMLPNPPLTDSQVELMRHDNVVGEGALSFKDLGIAPAPIETVLPTYVR